MCIRDRSTEAYKLSGVSILNASPLSRAKGLKRLYVFCKSSDTSHYTKFNWKPCVLSLIHICRPIHSKEKNSILRPKSNHSGKRANASKYLPYKRNCSRRLHRLSHLPAYSNKYRWLLHWDYQYPINSNCIRCTTSRHLQALIHNISFS